MKTCSKCGLETTVGNRKHVKRGVYEHRKCPEPEQAHSNKPVEAIHFSPKTNEANEVKTNEANARLFINTSNLERLQRIKSANPVVFVNMNVFRISGEYLDLHPEDFSHLTEINI